VDLRRTPISGTCQENQSWGLRWGPHGASHFLKTSWFILQMRNTKTSEVWRGAILELTFSFLQESWLNHLPSSATTRYETNSGLSRSLVETSTIILSRCSATVNYQNRPITLSTWNFVTWTSNNIYIKSDRMGICVFKIHYLYGSMSMIYGGSWKISLMV